MGKSTGFASRSGQIYDVNGSPPTRTSTRRSSGRGFTSTAAGAACETAEIMSRLAARRAERKKEERVL
jgi:hypothetical protein